MPQTPDSPVSPHSAPGPRQSVPLGPSPPQDARTPPLRLGPRTCQSPRSLPAPPLPPPRCACARITGFATRRHPSPFAAICLLEPKSCLRSEVEERTVRRLGRKDAEGASTVGCKTGLDPGSATGVDGADGRRCRG